MSIRHHALSLETISNPILLLTNEMSTISNQVCPNAKASNHYCMSVITSPNVALGYNDFLKARRREVDSDVNSLNVLKELGLKGSLKITEIVSKGGTAPTARARRGEYADG
jgi:hypothetical protein